MLKKLIASILMPMPIFLILALWALWELRRGRIGRGRLLLTSALIWIALLSWAPFTSLLLRHLEQRIVPVSDRNVTGWIHVLGSGHGDARDVPLASRPDQAGIRRVLEGVRRWRLHPESQMVFSGYRGDEERPTARVYAEVARSLGVPAERIVTLESPQDTAEEADALKRLVGDAPVLLVTSAAHMPRALAAFRRRGIDALPAPTDYRVIRTPRLLQWPGAEGLSYAEIAFHEYLGLLWQRLRYGY